jgi:hypothetical protein
MIDIDLLQHTPVNGPFTFEWDLRDFLNSHVLLLLKLLERLHHHIDKLGTRARGLANDSPHHSAYHDVENKY